MSRALRVNRTLAILPGGAGLSECAAFDRQTQGTQADSDISGLQLHIPKNNAIATQAAFKAEIGWSELFQRMGLYGKAKGVPSRATGRLATPPTQGNLFFGASVHKI